MWVSACTQSSTSMLLFMLEVSMKASHLYTRVTLCRQKAWSSPLAACRDSLVNGWVAFTVTSIRISNIEVALWLHAETLVNKCVTLTATSSRTSRGTIHSILIHSFLRISEWCNAEMAVEWFVDFCRMVLEWQYNGSKWAVEWAVEFVCNIFRTAVEFVEK